MYMYLESILYIHVLYIGSTAHHMINQAFSCCAKKQEAQSRGSARCNGGDKLPLKLVDLGLLHKPSDQLESMTRPSLVE